MTAYDSLNNNGFVVSVETATDTWTALEGRQSLTLTVGEKTYDATTADIAGWSRDKIISRSLEVKVEGLGYYETTTGAKAPGQAFCEGLSALTGDAAEGTFRVTLPESGKFFEFTGSVSVTAFGGGMSDGSKWSMDVKTTQPPTVVTVTP